MFLRLWNILFTSHSRQIIFTQQNRYVAHIFTDISMHNFIQAEGIEIPEELEGGSWHSLMVNVPTERMGKIV